MSENVTNVYCLWADRKIVRFNCIADVLNFLDGAGHKCYNVRGLMKVLAAGREYNAGPLVVRRVDNLKDRW